MRDDVQEITRTYPLVQLGSHLGYVHAEDSGSGKVWVVLVRDQVGNQVDHVEHVSKERLRETGRTITITWFRAMESA